MRLTDRRGPLFVEPEISGHPIIERRTRWRARPPEEASRPRPSSTAELPPSLTLQLLREPRRVQVREQPRRDHSVPVEYFDGRSWYALVTAAGPDRVSGGHWEEAAYAREYFRCATEAGVLVWLFHDALENAWYLHGWWD